ncbi:XrtA/PEP-CTERM system TPR-repeat protein PrsT [Motiliproteus sp.]|uniref:XrtA/PEP-CTERM system TPR-repeat protein PrsT n=1 Tax=Motiliproteus sp. TaxID=1898955 RepID=UPI003BAA582F
MRKKTTHSALAISLIAGLALSGCEAGKSDTEFLAAAQQDLANKAYQSAIINLKNAVSEDPQNAQSRALLGSALLATKQFSAAEKEYRKAIELGANRPELLADLAQILLGKRRYPDLLSETDELSGVPAADIEHIRLYRGLAALLLSRIDEARENFDAIAAGGSDFANLARGYQALLDDRTDDAIPLATNIKTPELLVEASILKAKAQAASEKNQEAIDSFSAILAANPERIEIYPQTILLHLKQQDTEAAEKTVDKLLKLAPNFDWALVTKAMIRLNQQDMEAARELSEKAIALRSRDIRAKMIAGMAHFYLNSYEASSKHLRSISSSLPANHIVQRILAYIDASQGKIDDTDNLLSLFDGSNPNDTRILSSLAGRLASQGEEEQAVSLLKQGARLKPNDPAILTQLGTMQLLQGQQEAEQSLNAALELNPEQTGAVSALVQQLIQTQQYDKARSVAEKLLQQQPDTDNSYLLLAEVDYAQRQYAEALNTIKRGLEKTPDNFQLLMAAAKSSAALENLQQTHAYLGQALAVNPTDRLALLNLYRTEKTLGDPDQAVRFIDQTLSQNPDTDTVLVAAATVKGDRQEYDAANQLLRKVEPTSEVYPIALGLLSNFALRQNDTAAAIRAVDQLVNLDPRIGDYQRLLVSLKIRNGDYSAALTQAQQSQQQLPQDPWFELLEVQLLFKTEQVQQALRRSDAFTSKHGETAVMATLLGIEYGRQGELEKAEQQLTTAYRLKASDSNAARLSKLQQQLGQWQAAESTLRQQLDRTENTLPLRIMLAEIYLKQPAQRERAVTEYQQLLKEHPDNLVALNNLASVYNDLNRYEDGLPLAERAYQLKPEIAAIQDTYGYLLLNTGQKNRALQLLQQAHDGNEADPSIAFHYAAALQQDGQHDRAREVLQPAVDQDFKEKQQAIALMELLGQ